MPPKNNSGRPARPTKGTAAISQVKAPTTAQEAPVEEVFVDEGFGVEEMLRPGTTLGEPPRVQRSVDMLQKIQSTHARQKIMRTIQRKYGNSYAGQVVGGLNSIQRAPASAEQDAVAVDEQAQEAAQAALAPVQGNGPDVLVTMLAQQRMGSMGAEEAAEIGLPDAAGIGSQGIDRLAGRFRGEGAGGTNTLGLLNEQLQGGGAMANEINNFDGAVQAGNADSLPQGEQAVPSTMWHPNFWQALGASAGPESGAAFGMISSGVSQAHQAAENTLLPAPALQAAQPPEVASAPLPKTGMPAAGSSAAIQDGFARLNQSVEAKVGAMSKAQNIFQNWKSSKAQLATQAQNEEGVARLMASPTIQRQGPTPPATAPAATGWEDDVKTWVNSHFPSFKKEKQYVGYDPKSPAPLAAYSKPVTITALPVAPIQNNLGTSGMNVGTTPTATNGTQYSAPVSGFSGNSVVIGDRTTATGEWQQNSTKLNESGTGSRTVWQGEKDDNKFTRSVTNGTLKSNSTADTDLLGVKTNTTRNDQFSGVQTQYSGGPSNLPVGQTITDSYTRNNGAWNYKEDKKATYTPTSLENQRDQRTDEITSTTSDGTGKRNQTSTTVENKNTTTNPLTGVNTVNTNTAKNTGDRIDGTWNTQETKTTNFGPGNKDNKTSETTVKGSSGNGVRDISEGSTEDKYETGNYTRSDKTTSKSALTTGNWSDVDNKETKYSTNRYESTQNTKNGTGTRQQNESTTENKRTYTQDGSAPQIYSDKTSTKDMTHTGTWDEKTVKVTKNDTKAGGLLNTGVSTETSTTNKWGSGTRTEKGYETSSDYKDKKGQDVSDSYTSSTKTTKGTEYSTNVTTTSSSTGYTVSGKANANNYMGFGNVSTDVKKEYGKPKDQSAPPPSPKMQEAVLWNYSDASDTRADLAKSQGTYHETGDKDNGTKAYSYSGGYTGTSTKATVTTGSATYQKSGTAGYSLIGGQYENNYKGNLGGATLTNNFKAGGTVGAEATGSYGGSISWNGDPSITGRVSGSAFAGAKGTVSNTTNLAYGKANANLALTGEALAGAEAKGNAELGISTKGLMAQGEASAFAGAKVSGTATGTLGYGGHNFLTAKGTAEASAGIGASAKGTFNIDWTTGTVTIGGGLSATLGLGAGASGEVSINFVEMGLAGAEAVYDGYEAIAKTPFGQQVGSFLKSAGQTISQKSQEIWHGIQAIPGKLGAMKDAAIQKFEQFKASLPSWNDIKQGISDRYNSAMTSISNFGNSVWQKVSGFGSSVKQWGSSALSTITGGIQSVGNTISNLAQSGVATFNNLVSGVSNAGKAGLQMLGNAKDYVMQQGAAFVNNLKSVGSNIKQGFSNAVNTLSNVGSQAWGMATNLFNSAGNIASNFKNQLGQTFSGLTSFGQNALQGISSTFQGIGSSAQQLGGKIMGGLQSVLSGGSSLANMAKSGLSSLASAGSSLVGGFIDKVNSLKSKLSGLPDLLRKPIESLLDTVTGKLGQAKSVSQSVTSTAQSLAATASQKASSAAQTVTAAKTGFENLAKTGVNLVKAGVDGVKSKVQTATQTVTAAKSSLEAKIGTAKSTGQAAVTAVKSKVDSAKSIGATAAATLGTATNTANSTVKNLWDGVKGQATGVLSSAKAVVSTSTAAATTAANVANSGWAGAKTTAQNLLAGAKASVQSASAQISETAGQIIAKGTEVKAAATQGVSATSAAGTQAKLAVQASLAPVIPGMTEGKTGTANQLTSIGANLLQSGQATAEQGKELTVRANQVIEAKIAEAEAAGAKFEKGLKGSPAARAGQASSLVNSKVAEGQTQLNAISSQVDATKAKAVQEGQAGLAQANQVPGPALAKTQGIVNSGLTAGHTAATNFHATSQAQETQAKAVGQAAEGQATAQKQGAEAKVTAEKAAGQAKQAQLSEHKATAQQKAQEQAATVNAKRQEASQQLQQSNQQLQQSQHGAQQNSQQTQAQLQQVSAQSHQTVQQQNEQVKQAQAQGQQTIEQQRQQVEAEHSKAQETASQQRQQVEAEHSKAQTQATQEQAKIQQEGAKASQTATEQQEELANEQSNVSSQHSSLKGQLNSVR